MTTTVEQMARAWGARDAERAERAAQRARRLTALMPEARQLLTERYGASGVLLFGSLAQGTARDTSDVDLAVEGLPAAEYFSALSDLMTLFAGPVDLVRIEAAPPGLRDRVFAEGRRL